MKPVDIAPADLETVRNILREHAPGLEARAFGSRVSWTARETSDLDLALMTAKSLDAARMAALRGAFADSDLPFRVDVVDWAGVSENFRKTMEKDCVALADANANDDMACAWPNVALKDLIDLRISNVDKKIKSGEDAVRLCNYMDVYRNSFIHGGLDFMNGSATKREVAKYSLRSGDVIITKDSEKHDDIGVPALVREDIPNLLCGYHLAILRPASPLIDGTYLFYALSAFEAQKQFHSYANGITRFGLRKADIGLAEIPLPPLPEQQAIAGVLCALDDKIALNRRINETLEAMARALFKSWFVDFDPVRAKMEGRHTALPPEFANPFPGALVDSGTGEIPEGWKNGTLHDIASLNPESWSSKRHPDKIIYVDLTNTKWGNIENLDTFSWDDSPHRARRVLRRCDTIIATVRPGNGSFALIDEEGLTGSTGFAVLRPDEVADRELVWCAGTSAANIARLAHIADGGAYPAVRSGAVLATPVVLADIATREAFSMLAGPLLDKIEANRRESRALAALRDSLLPKLVSGELRVNVDDRSPGETVR